MTVFNLVLVSPCPSFLAVVDYGWQCILQLHTLHIHTVGRTSTGVAGCAAYSCTPSTEKRSRYGSVLGDLVDPFDHFVPFIVETGHRLFDLCRMSLHIFCRQLRGAIARYNAMAAHSWLFPFLRYRT